ncbi:hypothetical protein DFJ74DRAFT_688443 [Hyaloraphidium curvatum]|nr:hypothetical protein DFJ74DRAFT_688443 [Hyaloraphidium curvatum]
MAPVNGTASPLCRGDHPVDGKKGCGNEPCRGLDLCVADCPGCPGHAHPACRGKHPADGPGGCGTAACRGRKRCVRTCPCPDAALGDRSGFFGGRKGKDIFVYVACLAGPADPAQRNDIRFVEGLMRRHGIPQENVYMLLERQCTSRAILATLADCVETVGPGQVLFLYLGGHGHPADGNSHWSLGSYGATGGADIAALLARCCGEVFVVTDSCHSGGFALDLKATLARDPANWMSPRLTFLGSAQASVVAQTGWKLVAMLIECAEGDRAPREAARFVCGGLRTPERTQRAQLCFFEGREVVEETDQRI